MGLRCRLTGLGGVFFCATVAVAQPTFQRILDSPDERLLHGAMEDFLVSPLGDEMPFMLGGICHLRRAQGDAVLLTRYNASATILEIGDEPPVFSEESVIGPPLYYSGCATGDVNGDGLADLLLLAARYGGDLYTTRQAADAVVYDRETLALVPEGAVTSAFFGDYDNDGDLDLVVLVWNPSVGPVLLENDGTGAFTDVSGKLGLGKTETWGFAGGFADLDDDGWLDLLLAADFGTSKVLLNQAGQSFADVTAAWNAGTDENGMGSAIGDVDGDGDLDWFVTSIHDPADTCSQFDCNWGTTGNRLYINEGGTHFRDATDDYGVREGGWGWGASFLDYDNDGDLDLVMTNGIQFPDTSLETLFNDDPVRLWRNDGKPPLVEVSADEGLVDTRSGKGLAVFDLGNDGDLDVGIANAADYASFFQNVTGNANSWLRVDLTGIQSNTLGFGARILVTPVAGGPSMMHEVHGNNNFMSQNEPTAHFGLGSHEGPVAEIRVHWPVSGITTILRNVMPRRQIRVHEVRSGDLTGDDSVDLRDYAEWLTCFGQVAPDTLPWPCLAADVNADGLIDLGDWQGLWSEF